MRALQGEMLRDFYIDQYPLLPGVYDADTASQNGVFLRSDDSPRTVQSAESMFLGQ